MGDFVVQTALEPVGEGRYRALLSEEWMLWGACCAAPCSTRRG